MSIYRVTTFTPDGWVNEWYGTKAQAMSRAPGGDDTVAGGLGFAVSMGFAARVDEFNLPANKDTMLHLANHGQMNPLHFSADKTIYKMEAEKHDIVIPEKKPKPSKSTGVRRRRHAV